MKKKSLIILLVFTLIISNMSIVFADQGIKYDKISENSFKKVKEKALKENKVITEKKYNEIVSQLQKDSDVDKFKKSLEKYAVFTEHYYPNNDATLFATRSISATQIGDTRITTTDYYQFENKTDDTYSVADGNEINPDVTLGFLSFLPAPYGTGFGVVSLLKTIAGVTDSEISSMTSIYERSYYDSVITVRYAEVYTETGWDVAALSERRQCDGYYTVSGYKNGYSHFVESKSVGKLRVDLGKYYYDTNQLLSYAVVGHVYHYIFDYLSDVSMYYSPQL